MPESQIHKRRAESKQIIGAAKLKCSRSNGDEIGRVTCRCVCIWCLLVFVCCSSFISKYEFRVLELFHLLIHRKNRAARERVKKRKKNQSFRLPREILSIVRVLSSNIVSVDLMFFLLLFCCFGFLSEFLLFFICGFFSGRHASNRKCKRTQFYRHRHSAVSSRSFFH